MTQNENWFDDLTESQARFRILIGLLAFGFIIFIFRDNIVQNFNRFEQNKVLRKEEFKEKYLGIVVCKGRDNRNNTFVKLNDSSKIFQNEEKIWKRILVGDSVAKNANSKFLYVTRGNNTFIIDYDDAYGYRDSLMRTGNY
jgi:hypothetical protein